jgi:hypothetical protein
LEEKMTPWEYKIEVVNLDGEKLDGTELDLGVLGNAGWEIVTVVQCEGRFLAIMQRPFQPKDR